MRYIYILSKGQTSVKGGEAKTRKRLVEHEGVRPRLRAEK